MPAKITAGVIGLGSIAQKAHLPVIAAHPSVDIIALCSRSGANVDALADRYHLALRARTFEELLAVKPQAAWLLSSTLAHPDQAVALLEAGIAVYMEKPLANDLDGARRIAQAAAQPGRLLMVGFNRRYAPAYRKAARLFAESGRAIELVQIHKHRYSAHSTWGLRQLVMDDAIHIIDLARYFAGPDLALQAATCRLSLTAAHLRTPAGVVAQISQSHGAGAQTERLELHGGGLSVIVESMERMTILDAGSERHETIGGSWTSTLEKRGIAPAADHFIECLRTGAQPETPAGEALRSQELAEAILQAGE